MSAPVPQSRSLLQHSVTMFGLLALLLLLAFKGASLMLSPWSAHDHRDGRALTALKTLERGLRPASEVGQRLGSAQDVAAITACGKESEALFQHLQEIEGRLGVLTGLDESGEIRGNRRLPERLVIDAATWQAALAEGGFDCTDLKRGLALLTKPDNGAALESLHWSMFGLEERKKKGKPLDAPWMTVPDSAFARATPWSGLPGCIVFGGSKNAWYVANGRNTYCATALGERFQPAGTLVGPSALKEATWLLPDSLSTLLAELDQVRLPSTQMYREITTKGQHGPNRLKLEGHERDTGFHIRLTLDPAAQRIAQQTARCYAGERNACTALGLSDKEFQKIGGEFYEQAAVRMTGIAIIDVKTGRIDALASAHTECYRQQYDGPGRDAHCPPLTRPPRYSPDMLLNHAVFADAMPASTVKPILALGFLETPGYEVDNAVLTRQLKLSDSQGFLDRLFCLDTGAGATGCPRLAHAQTAATQLGWNAGCAPGGVDCGFVDILFGRRSTERLDTSLGTMRPLGLRSLNGRLFTSPLEGGRMSRLGLMSERALQFDSAKALECHNKGWEKCSGNAVATPAAEGWGQGSARATPLGVAAMFARLGAAAEGQKIQRRPHLVESISGIQGKSLSLAGLMQGQDDALDIRPDLATRVVNGLTEGHRPDPNPKPGPRPRHGTAYRGCLASGVGDCEGIRWVAGKTGTPPFGFDKVTLATAAKACTLPDHDKRCDWEIPYKWYAALFKSSAQVSGFDKAIAVLSERNWYESGELQGKVDAPGDNGPNRSAEIAFRIMGKLRSETASQAPGSGKQ